MKTLFLIPLLALFASLPARAEVVDKVVAIVGNEIITLSDVKSYSAQRSANGRAGGPNSGLPASKDPPSPIEALIREKLLKSEMERLGVTATDEEINAAIQDVVTRNHVTLDFLKGEIAKKGMPFEQYKKELGNQIRQMKFLSQVIFPRIRLTEDEVNLKAGPNASDQTRMKARMELMQAHSSDELVHYIDEARAKTYVEIKK